MVTAACLARLVPRVDQRFREGIEETGGTDLRSGGDPSGMTERRRQSVARPARGDYKVPVRIQIAVVDVGVVGARLEGFVCVELDLDVIRALRNLDRIAAVGGDRGLE